MSSRIFLDANAGLAVRPEAIAEFQRVERDCPGNPSSLHRSGRKAQGVLETARSKVASLLRCNSSELVFTSGATEASNLALLGMVRATSELQGRKLCLLASQAEHPAVLGPLRLLQQEGHRLRFLELDSHGRSKLETWPEDPPDLVAMQWANNETGVVQPLQELLELLPPNCLWFCDAVQGIGKLDFSALLLSASSFVLSGHKFGAPKGIGAWALRADAMFAAPIVGGGHQRGRRPGTESPSLAAALAIALELSAKDQEENAKNWEKCRTEFLAAIRSKFSALQENHPQDGRGLMNTLSLSFPGVDGRMLLPALDADGLDVSAGSACSSGAPTPSPVLLSANASIRVSFSPSIELSEARRAAEILCMTVARLYEVANR